MAIVCAARVSWLMPRPDPEYTAGDSGAAWASSCRGQGGEGPREASRVTDDVPVEPSLRPALHHLDRDDEGAILAEHPVVGAAKLLLRAHLDGLVDTGAPSDRRQA